MKRRWISLMTTAALLAWGAPAVLAAREHGGHSHARREHAGKEHAGGEQATTPHKSTVPPGHERGRKKGWKGESHPPGWEKGKKTGWEGESRPPGKSK